MFEATTMAAMAMMPGICARCIDMFRFDKGAATWPALMTDARSISPRRPSCKLFRQGEFDDLVALKDVKVVVRDQ